MNIGIVCFSQTGNTWKIAECISGGIADAGARCRLIRFEDVFPSELDAFDRVGIGCPVFYYREPMHIRDWIHALPNRSGQHWFVFCTHGNVIGNFFPSMTDLLQGKGAALIGCFHSYAGIRVPFLPSPGFTEGHPDAEDLAAAVHFGRQMARTDAGILEKTAVPGPVSSQEWIEEADKFSAGFLKKTMPALTWDQQRCSGCGICQDQCPVSGIDLGASPPRLQEPCIYCFNCVAECPEGAICADWGRLIARAPAYFAHCRKELDRAAEKDEFRWLVDPDAVDPKEAYILQRFRPG